MPVLTFTINAKNISGYMVVGKNEKFHPCKQIRIVKTLIDRDQ